jgi:CheY-like chemotaxis protein
MTAIARQWAEDSDASGQKTFRILYAEDQASSRTVTTALLQRLGYHVDAVEDGELALALARAHHYDVILLDIEMPVMDGITAARMIRAETTPCSATPILALSALIADTKVGDNWNGIFDSTLPKPANRAELKRAVAKALNRSDPRPATVAPDLVIRDLQNVLPRGAWSRLVTSAAAEMNSLAITLSACLELQDQDNADKAARALYTLARNFGADGLCHLVTQAEAGPGPGRSGSTRPIPDLLAAIVQWRNACAGGTTLL